MPVHDPYGIRMKITTTITTEIMNHSISALTTHSIPFSFIAAVQIFSGIRTQKEQEKY